MRFTKTRDLLITLLIYLVVVGLGFLLLNILPFTTFFIKLFVITIIASIFLFILSLILKNEAIIEPYWFFSPAMTSLAYFLNQKNYDITCLMLLSFIILWASIGLVIWCFNFKGLRNRTFKYQYLKEKFPKIYYLISFGLFFLLPTLISFIAMMPCFYYFGNSSGSLMTMVAFAVILIGIILEMVSDCQLYLFKRIPSNDYLVYTRGLFKNSRHPNYFGEILFFLGLFLVYYSSASANFLVIGSPLIVFIYSVFVRIPFIEKEELSTKSAYKEYINSTNQLLPLFPPKK